MTKYRWSADPEPDDAELAADLKLGFPRRTEAEDWLATFADDLAEAGSRQVTLLENGRPIVGPMDLAPAEER
ncbi:MAG: hypothetical protein LBS56_01135 [Propionibacteriaceae bacterium]|jgi:hypothetical protein|nr:hypothetical protein [Propionibacteriaceae bacterium]